MHRTLLLLLLFLLLNYFTDIFHICMIQWNNNKYEYEYIFRHSKNKISSFITLFSSVFSMSQHCKFKKTGLPYLESLCGFPGLVIFSYHCKLQKKIVYFLLKYFRIL